MCQYCINMDIDSWIFWVISINYCNFVVILIRKMLGFDLNDRFGPNAK